MMRLAAVPICIALVVSPGAPPIDPEPADRSRPGETRASATEADVRQLPGEALAGTVADISGDGVREIVRLVPLDEDPLTVGVEAWREVDDGWQRLAERPTVTRGSTTNDLVPLRSGEPARFLVWRDGSRERLLVVAIGSRSSDIPCCLAIHEILLSRGSLRLELLERSAGTAVEVHVGDMDGDGVDELVVVEPSGIRGQARVRVLRWEEPGFSEVASGPLPDQRSTGVMLDSTGRDGDELVLFGRLPGPVSGGAIWALLRISLEGGELKREEAMPPAVLGPALISRSPSGSGLLLTSADGSVHLVSWPADGGLLTEARSSVRGYPLAVLGSGTGARVLLLEGSFLSDWRETSPRLQILDAALGALETVEPTHVALDFRRLSVAANETLRGSEPWPYVGPLPGGLGDGREAFIFNGQLVAQAPDAECTEECATVSEMAPLPATRPLGVAGAEGGWMLLVRGARLADVSTSGGALEPLTPTATRWTLTPTELVLTGARQTAGWVTHHGVTEDAARPGSLLTGPDGFETRLRAPAGSQLYVHTGGPPVPPQTVGPSGSVTVGMPPDPAPAGADPIPVTFLVVTPAGGALLSRAEVTVLNDAPTLVAETDPFAFSFSVRLSGAVGELGTVTVDGRPVSIGPGGRFSASVDAGLWPRDVSVVAADPVGNRRVEIVSVVGPIDYRQLPWPAIVLALTVAAGLYLALRRPQLGARLPVEEDAAALVEVDDQR